MADKKLNLLAEFPAVTPEQWMNVVTKDLKGADFGKKLVWRTNEGFNVQPFYTVEDTDELKITDVKPAAYPYVRSTKTTNEWRVRQDICVETATDANKKALNVLSRGATSIGFRLEKTDLSPEYVAQLLSGIIPTAVELNFTICVSKSAELISILTDYFKENNFYSDPKLLIGSVNVDPINCMLSNGKNLTKEFILDRIKSTIAAAAELPFYKVVGVNALTLNNAGAFCAQELGYALAWGNQYLSMLIEAGVDKSLAAKKIKFNFGIGSNYFMEIAKFRAARLLWAQIVNAYQPTCSHEECPNNKPGDICRCAMKMSIHAETTRFNMTTFDANVNMLRTQTEAMSATIAGVDSLTVLPYDVTFKKSDDFSERIARNQQLLLKEECHFGKVIDPSAGSYYIETLTDELAKQAWKIFLDVEDAGGFFDAIESGTVQQTLKTTAANRLKAISSRKEILLGTNQFPNSAEKATGKIEIESTPTSGTGCGHTGNNLETLPPIRGAKEFEELRFSTEKSEKTPKAFMLTIGNLSMRLARAQFSSNFFACAGYEILDNLGFETIEAGVKAALNANANVVVLCSGDEEYTELAPAAFELLKNTGALLVVAGAPASMDELKAKGIEHFIHVKSNVLETLKAFNNQLVG